MDTTIQELLETESLQWIFVGGKGGVGKTTASCSLAIKLASVRESVLILSTDPAHNLSDAFGQKFAPEPTIVKGFDNLYAMEVGANQMQKHAKMSNDPFGLAAIMPDLLSSFPGIDEAMSFAELMGSVQSMRFSVIVFDTAPTGHTLRLLSFPYVLEKGLGKFGAVKDKMAKAFNMFNVVGGQSVDPDEFLGRFDALRAVTTSVRNKFQDPMKTTFVCVCIPEFLSVYETERLAQELTQQGIDCSNIVVNQVLLPVGETIQYQQKSIEQAEKHLEYGTDVANLRKKMEQLANNLQARRRMQSKYMAQIVDLYGTDFHVICVPLQTEEVRGPEKLTKFAELLVTAKPLPMIGN